MNMSASISRVHTWPRVVTGCVRLSRLVLALLVLLAVRPASPAAEPAPGLEAGFQAPPASTKPWCYWYWISDNISREGITRDLEAMARAGIGEALIGNIHIENVPTGEIKVLSEAWWSLVEHAIREGGRVGVHIGMFNCPGWSQSGGPWIRPEQSMRHLVSSETRVRGPVRFEQKLPAPREPFQDVAVLAFPAPEGDGPDAALAPRLTSTPEAPGLEALTDGKLETAFAFPAQAGQGGKPFVLDLELAAPATVRSLSLTPGTGAWSARGELQAAGEDGSFRTVTAFLFDRSNMEIHVGPLPRGPVLVSFAPATARRFRVVWTSVSGPAALAALELSPAARLASYVEKQLGKMHPTPLPMWDTYLWPAAPEPEKPGLAVASKDVQDLSARLDRDGTLRWDAPAGDWVVLRTGMTPTGTSNAPASPEGRGLEVDKMNRVAAQAHFDAFIGQVVKRMPAAERKAFRRVVADSYEMGSQNWTDGFAQTFRKRHGYDPIPWLPVLSGRVVGSAEQSDRFLWDLRRLVADHVAEDYVGGLREACRAHGLQLWLENYGHWGFPAEFLQYGSRADAIGGEFWVTGDLGSIECRAASSCANTYGKPVVSAEAFTGGPAFQTVPASMKARGDWAFCEGINHFVLHVYIQQPWEDRVPGVNAWFGTEFNRHNTWFEAGRAWVDYLRRCCFLLQQGARLADVAYFIGEDTPKMTGVRQPELPPGHDFDYINAEVIEGKLAVKDGQLVLPHGAAYRVLVLPELPTMRPAVLRKIRDLVRAGATVLGPPPARSPSLEGYPACDAEVQKLAAEVWGAAGPFPAGASGERRLGQGRVVWGRSLVDVLQAMQVGPDFQSGAKMRFTHRVAGGAHLYFVANPENRPVATTLAFRVAGRAPELWWPESGRREKPAVFEAAGEVVRLPVNLGPNGSVFVVFREKATGAQVVAVTREGQPLLDTSLRHPVGLSTTPESKAPAGTFTLTGWVKPAADTVLLPEAASGVHGIDAARNDALFPPHGSTFGDATHAGCGVAAGRNGVSVFEHSGNYFSPVLVCPAALTHWTHVAVVYRAGVPELYLNGVFARQGLKSGFTVHGLGGLGGGPTPFQGEQTPLEALPRALEAAEIAQIMKASPPPLEAGARPALELVRAAKGGIEARAWQPGAYALKLSDGGTRQLDVPALPAACELAGPWEVSFTPGWDAPERVTFDRLVDWTQRAEEGIRFYSGTAVYRKTFELPAALQAGPGRALALDLGQVRDLATVRLNGQNLGTLWLAPWRLDVTAAVRPGTNTLEIEVVNPWNNRLVGDTAKPAAQRRTYISAKTVKKGAPLLPAGLLGPVTLQAGHRQVVH